MSYVQISDRTRQSVVSDCLSEGGGYEFSSGGHVPCGEQSRDPTLLQWKERSITCKQKLALVMAANHMKQKWMDGSMGVRQAGGCGGWLVIYLWNVWSTAEIDAKWRWQCCQHKTGTGIFKSYCFVVLDPLLSFYSSHKLHFVNFYQSSMLYLGFKLFPCSPISFFCVSIKSWIRVSSSKRTMFQISNLAGNTDILIDPFRRQSPNMIYGLFCWQVHRPILNFTGSSDHNVW